MATFVLPVALALQPHPLHFFLLAQDYNGNWAEQFFAPLFFAGTAGAAPRQGSSSDGNGAREWPSGRVALADLVRSCMCACQCSSATCTWACASACVFASTRLFSPLPPPPPPLPRPRSTAGAATAPAVYVSVSVPVFVACSCASVYVYARPPIV